MEGGDSVRAIRRKWLPTSLSIQKTQVRRRNEIAVTAVTNQLRKDMVISEDIVFGNEIDVEQKLVMPLLNGERYLDISLANIHRESTRARCGTARRAEKGLRGTGMRATR
jgi:hypothetical protein